RGPECGQPAIELPHHCLIRQARRGDQAQRPTGKTLLLFLLAVGHMAMGARRQQCIYHRAPQSAGATGYHHVTIAKIHPTLCFPSLNPAALVTAFFSSRARDLVISFSSRAPTLKRSLRPSAASSSVSAVTRMAWASPQSAGIDSALTSPPV